MLPRTLLLAMLTIHPALAQSSPAKPSDAPVWFTRVPSVLTAQDIHDTSYLQCKMAHNGRTEWPSTMHPVPEPLAERPGSCTRCFCLPDTRQVGCAPAECEREARRLVRRRRALREPRKAAALYVNHEACVKAREAAMHRGVTCVCRQNGALECPGE
ncbi:hypothetical protein GGI15_002795 [Coemansia interrupta]|uniref:Secreted protein n=1 Tax=Coemansia interrupta TaxID=1126814 RepID=A0A9W8LKH1_9FUNG|nr:hypothetical protein GGI15_002795 [Coemansia interrupta]